MNGCVVAEKTLVCYKGDDKPCTNKQTNKDWGLCAPQRHLKTEKHAIGVLFCQLG